MTILKKLFPYIVIFGIFAIMLNNLFNEDNALFSTITTNSGLTMYKLDLHKYIYNLENMWKANTLQFNQLIQTRTWQTTNATMLQSEFWNVMINNLAYIFNWLYLPINIICFILRFVMYLAYLILGFLGFNTEYTALNGTINSTSPLMGIIEWIFTYFQIPYI